MKTQFIGDVHGDMELLGRLVAAHRGPSIQLGDLGLGMPSYRKHEAILVADGITTLPDGLPNDFKFVRGNHDSPEACAASPHYLGDWGMAGIAFYLSGGLSIDQDLRMHGVDWWPEEELSIVELGKAMSLYERAKPIIVISHACPTSIVSLMHTHHGPFNERTAQAMDAMLERWRPRFWVFGHHHRPWRRYIGGTDFICVAKNEAMRLDIDLRIPKEKP